MSGPKPSPEIDSTFGQKPWISEVKKEELTPAQRENQRMAFIEQMLPTINRIDKTHQEPESSLGEVHDRRTGTGKHRHRLDDFV
jgi:hypothetical protein